MELMPAEEIFEVNSNSTTDTLKEQRLARNKELRLKATYLVSRRPIKNQQKEYNSESSSEFPASSPSNPQMQRKSQYQTRPPLLKNTLPANEFERGLALIATKEPQMTMSEKIESWQCVTEEFSDVEDVVNFDAVFEQREENKIKQLSKTKYELKNKSQKDSSAPNQVATDTCYSFTEFQRRLLAIDPRKTNLPGIEQKHNSKLTSEEDEKPTTSNNCLARNRDTPLKKRACKYKRAAEPIAHLPNKKSSSSDTPRDGAPSPKKKVQPQKILAATAAGEDVRLCNEKMVCPSSSETSSQLVKNDNAYAGTYARNSRSQTHTKPKPTKIVGTTSINTNWNRVISSTNNAKNDEQESFFRWRRLSREIDKLGNLKRLNQNVYQLRQSQSNSSPNEKQGLIQIRYDFFEPSNISKTIVPQTNAYNVVVKPLKKEEPNDVITSHNIHTNSSKEGKPRSILLQTISNCDEPFIKTEKLKENVSVNSTIKDAGQDSGMEFHQQHEFCNYLGLTGMSTANAMANAAAELSKCNLARRSLRVRNLEQRKAKSKHKSEAPKKTNERITKEKQEQPTDSVISPAVTTHKTDDTTVEKSIILWNQTPVAATNQKEEINVNRTTETTLSVPIECVQNTKEKEAKIKILCQITNSNNKSDNQNNKIFAEKLTIPKRRTVQRHYEQGNLLNASKSNTNKDGSKLMSGHIECDKDDKKYMDLLTMPSIKRRSNDSPIQANEVQTLHQKVQKCLEEARQNAPHIFIVQSLDSTMVNQKSSPPNKTFDVTEYKPDAAYAVDRVSSTSKISMQSNKSIKVNNMTNMKLKKPKTRGNMRSNTSCNRRLYTRSMLNLNQQRELRNRKVILKILKTYSGLKIKVSKPKTDRRTIHATEENQSTQSNGESDEQKKVAMSKVTKTISDSNEKILASLPQNSIPSNGDIKSTLPEITMNVNTNVLDNASINVETETVFNNEIVKSSKNSQHDMSSSSKIVPTKFQAPVNAKSESENKIFAELINQNLKPEKMTEVAVQTDPLTHIQPLTISAGRSPYKIQDSLKLRYINGEMDVSSSDMVTSTTSGVGDHNRSDPKTSSPNLVTKEIYENFVVDGSTIAANAMMVDASSANHMIQLNPHTNVSISSTINDLGIHALYEPNKALRNPLQDADGPVLHIFFEFDILIVIQESLVSFWKYIRVLNALMVKPQKVNIDEIHCKSKFTDNSSNREILTSEHQSLVNFQNSDLDDTTSSLTNKCEWIYLGARKRLRTDIEIESPYMNRLCLSESRPVYIEMRCRELINEFRECNLLSCYVNVYFFNEEDQVAVCHSIQLDSIQSISSDIIYTAINDSRYFVLAWPQANVLGKVRSGLCKYALTPELDMLATTRDFKAMRHVLRSLECLSDGKLLGFGDTQLTVWDHRSGDILMNYDLSMPLGRNLGTIYYPSHESGQNNVIIMIQHVWNETTSDLLIIACTISHMNPSRRVLQRYSLPTPAFLNIRNGVNNGEHFIIQSNTGEEIVISCNDPHQLIFVPAQNSVRFYTRGRTQVIELTKLTLTVDSFSSYLLKIAAGLNAQKK